MKAILIFCISVAVSTASLAQCAFQKNFGISKNHFSQMHDADLLPIPGEWGLEEFILEKKDLCPNDKVFAEINAVYSFLDNRLVEIKITSIEENTRNLIEWAKSEFGVPKQQSKEDAINLQVDDENQYWWSLSHMDVVAEYAASTNQVVQEVKFISSSHDNLFIDYYVNTATGPDPTYSQKIHEYRLSISDQYE